MPTIIAAAATPMGHSAIAVVRLSGEGCLRLTASFLRIKSPLPAQRPTLVWAHDQGDLLDQALLTHFPAGRSYTGEEMIELSLHGSPYIVRRILELCQRAGARLAEPGEFTRRAFLNGRLDLAQAEAVCELIRSRTSLAHRAAVSQLEGGLSRRVVSFRGRIVELMAFAEAALDHPEDDIPELSPSELLKRMESIVSDIQKLKSTPLGARLARGARIPIVGPPNAGKSSLLNCLLGSERAIVSEEPGTTRDAISEPCDLGGIETLLIDTAGLREAPSGPIESQGIARAYSELKGADMALLVLDRTQPVEPHLGLVRELKASSSAESRPLVLVLNKADANPARIDPRTLSAALGETDMPVAEVSALQGDGIADLVALIRRQLLGGCSSEDGEVGADIASLRHRQALESAAGELSLARGLILLEGSARGELVCAHLRAALEALDAIVGKTTNEDLLGEIFSRFCVGK